MATKQIKDLSTYILQSVGEVNPYNRQGQNIKSEFYIYQMGWLAGHLASIFEEDPIRFREFREHIKSQKRY